MIKVNKRTLKILLCTFLSLGTLLLIAVSIVYYQANLPRMKAKNETEKIAQKYANVTSVEAFYQFNRKQTYYTVVGKDVDGKKVVVIVSQKDKKITVLDESDCLGQVTAEKTIKDRHKDIKTTKNCAIGIFEDQPVWEVVGEHENGALTYYLINLKDGQDVSTPKSI